MEETTEPSATDQKGGTLNHEFKETGSSNNSGTQGTSTLSATHCCTKCGKGYQTRSGMLKHLKECGSRDRRKCGFCEREFATFLALRCHERAAHKDLYMEQEEQKAKPSEAEVFAKIAEMEANKKSNYFLNDIAQALGLTKDQVRHRRDKPEYREYLRRAREKAKSSMSLSPWVACAKKKIQVAPASDDNKRSTDTKSAASTCGTIPKNLEIKTTIKSLASSQPLQETKTTIKPLVSSQPLPRTPRQSDTICISVSPTSANESSNLTANEIFYTPPSAESETSIKRRCITSDTIAQETPKRAPTSASEAIRGQLCKAPINIISDIIIRPSLKRNREPEEDDDTLPPALRIRHDTRALNTPETSRGQSISVNMITNNDTNINQPIEVSSQTTGDFTPGGTGSNVVNGPEAIIAYLQNFILDEMSKPPTDRNTLNIELAKYALYKPTIHFQTKLTEWLEAKFKQKKGNNNTPNNNNSNVQDNPNRARANGSQKTKSTKHYAQQYTGRGLRAQNYKKAQDLYASNRATLATDILSGKPLDASEASPSVESVEAHFASILENPSLADNEEISDFKDPANNTDGVITEEEILEAKNGWNPSAPGPDGITVNAVKGFGNAELALLYNSIFFRTHVPNRWRNSRTILIYKDGDKIDPGNYRPITISSSVMRLLHRIIARRIKNSISLNLHQRGFTDADGTLANTIITQHYIRQRIEGRKTYNILSLDLQKAFDSVNQGSVIRALRRLGVSEHTIKYVNETFVGATTQIKVGKITTRKINISRGVKQGDPLSPILFNAVIDELLCRLQALGRGGSLDTNGNIKCPATAFADDLLIFEDHDKHLPLDLDMIDTFLRSRGMRLNAKKCSLISGALIPRAGKVIPRSKPFLSHNGTLIRMATDFDPTKYLGHKLGASGLLKPTISNLQRWLNNVAKAPLKPDQKLGIIKQFVIPKMLYGLQQPKVTGKLLREADRMVGYHVKRILHLNIHTPNASLYAKIKDGGLGITHLKFTIPRLFLGRLNKLLDCSDEDVSLAYVVQGERIRGLMSRLQTMAGAQPPDIYWANAIKEGPFTKGLEEAASDPASRSWIDAKPAGWSGKDFVKAIQLRTANLPTMGLPSNPPERRNCRAGCNKVESISHVLQGCPSTHWERIKRHNEIAKKMAAHCKTRKFNVVEEPHIRHEDGTLFKPDLITVVDDAVIITDTQVVWEGTLTLDHQHENKRSKYEGDDKFQATIKRLYPGKTIVHAPLTLGARGTWPRCNTLTVNMLQITPALKASMISSVLKWGNTIHAAFGRKVWRGRRN